MFKQKRKVKFHYKPPQKTKITGKEQQRGLIVGVALLFLVFVVSFWGFFSTNLIGLATFSGSQERYSLSMDFNEDNTKMMVKIDPADEQVTGVYLEMTTTTEGLDLCRVRDTFNNGLWSGDFYKLMCMNNRLIFSDAGLSEPKTGIFTVMEFSVTEFPQNFNLIINPLDVYALDDGADLFANEDYSADFTIPIEEVITVTETPPVETPPETAPETPSAPSGGGGGYRCLPEWSCTDWGYCNNQLQQERICYDQNKCEPNKAEPRDCAKCDESWVCTQWSSCSYNQQTRTCSDEHQCGTVSKKPQEMESCTETVPVQPQQQYYQPPQQYQAPQVQQPVVQEPSFFSKYKNYLIAIPFVLLFIVILVVAVLHFTQRKGGTTFNYNELKQWIQKERAAGSNDEEIRQILAQNTGWNKDEINKMLGEAGS